MKQIGLITERNILLEVLDKGKNLNELRAQDVMTFPIQWMRETDSLSEVMQLFSRALAQIKADAYDSNNNQAIPNPKVTH